MTALATTTQLGLFLQRSIPPDDQEALLQLELASSAVRAYLRCNVDRGVTVEELDPDPGGFVILSGWPLNEVQRVEIRAADGTWRDVTAQAGWSLNAAIVYAATSNVSWPLAYRSWRVTYDAGWDPVPAAIAAVTAQIAAAGIIAPAGVRQESLGEYSVQYSRGAPDDPPLTAEQQMVLAPYRNPVIG